jgi:hypothetical protein
MARWCSQVHAKCLVLIVLVGMGGGGVAPAAAQEGFVHDEVQVFGSSNRYMNDRARAVTARRGDAEGEEGLFSRAMAHAGEFQGILLDANSNQIGAAAPSSGQSGGYVQFTGSFPSLGCPTPPCPYYFYSYTFVDSTEFQQEIGAASLAGVARLVPAVSDEVTIMLSLVLDSSMTMGSAWPDLVAAYADMIRDQNIVPRDGSVAINVVGVAGDAHMRVPWTTIDEDSYEGFAWAVEHLPWIVTSSATSPINGRHHNLGVVMSADSMQDGPLSACWRVIHLAASQENGPTFDETDLEAARDYALDPFSPLVNQVNGLAIPNLQGNDVDRIYLLLHAVGSTESDVGFAAEVDHDWPNTISHLLDRLWIVLSRETVCPGDYNRDGVVDQQDIDDFISGAANNDQYADWNMDLTVDIPPSVPPYPDDFVAFMASWLAPCPCP